MHFLCAFRVHAHRSIVTDSKRIVTFGEAGVLMMTIAVYRIGKDGQRQTVRAEHVVTPVGEIPVETRWPPCRCFLCREKSCLRLPPTA